MIEEHPFDDGTMTEGDEAEAPQNAQLDSEAETPASEEAAAEVSAEPLTEPQDTQQPAENAVTESAPPVVTEPDESFDSFNLDAKIVAAVNINGSDLSVMPDVAYSEPKSVEGLSIATFPAGSIQDIVMKKWLNENGVDVSKIKFHALGPGEAVTAIEAGKVDGVFRPHPSPAKIELDGKGKTVVQSGEMWPNHAWHKHVHERVQRPVGLSQEYGSEAEGCTV